MPEPKIYKSLTNKKIENEYGFMKTIIIGLVTTLIFGGWVLGIIGFGYAIWLKQNPPDTPTPFEAISDFNSMSSPQNTLLIPCSNLTLGNETAEFSGDTYFVSTCPTTDNQCSEFICKTDGYCGEQTISGGECYFNSQCGASSRCDLDTCACVNETSSDCVTDSDCGGASDNPCHEFVCVSGVCSLNLTAGSECSSSTGCGSGNSCNSTCQCVPVVDVQEYTITVSSSVAANQAAWTYSPIPYSFSIYKDLGEWVEVTIEVDLLQTNNTLDSSNVNIDFNLPILADSSVAGVGTFTVGCTGLLAVPTQCFSCVGDVYVSDSTHGQAVCNNQNSAYTGPSDNTRFGIIVITLNYLKA